MGFQCNFYVVVTWDTDILLETEVFLIGESGEIAEEICNMPRMTSIIIIMKFSVYYRVCNVYPCIVHMDITGQLARVCSLLHYGC